ncbi:hypothetical protein BMETH_114_0 [methanotrophic bacterial endosymbiont of Bathymodiolus sp.]|nr:hypothetical protein BMETH_114_0 [methanotrophic bacterial endosymbiont of Bathymodiolus sp.]
MCEFAQKYDNFSYFPCVSGEPASKVYCRTCRPGRSGSYERMARLASVFMRSPGYGQLNENGSLYARRLYEGYLHRCFCCGGIKAVI